MPGILEHQLQNLMRLLYKFSIESLIQSGILSIVSDYLGLCLYNTRCAIDALYNRNDRHKPINAEISAGMEKMTPADPD